MPSARQANRLEVSTHSQSSLIDSASRLFSGWVGNPTTTPVIGKLSLSKCGVIVKRAHSGIDDAMNTYPALMSVGFIAACYFIWTV